MKPQPAALPRRITPLSENAAMATVKTPAAPFGAITLHSIVVSVEKLFGLNDPESFTENLSPRQRLDIGLIDAAKPVLIDPLVQIMAAGRR
jgi:hypothetical protein